ncbi:LysM domain containing protein [Parasponia andersonii]|uniref:LysM domain containing protein n=1 Tax=Parasponia andersonii TaxID=3476 RepID=A0A2P5ARS6_PARAD|nr:LysM domain containing protein [Parasponia andersonii]
MSDSQSGAGADGAQDNTVAKTAGFVVFSGIAMSILKALIPLNKNRSETQQPLTESTQPIQILSQPYPPKEPAVKKPVTYMDQNAAKAPESSQKRIEIVKGDTLWGLSKKYGVSIDAIKEANGLTGNTIYAGKKLIIP